MANIKYPSLVRKKVPKAKTAPKKAAKPKAKKISRAKSDYVSYEKSNLENYLAGYNKSGFTAYPAPESDELLNAYLRGYNLGIMG